VGESRPRLERLTAIRQLAHIDQSIPKNSGALAHWEILALPPSEDPNTGTSGVGVFPAYCQTVGTNPPDYFGAAILCATNVNGKTYQGN
jgi:hypothetical protein